jgi:hypothetical protein
MTSILRTVVVAALLAAWSFPAAAATNEGASGTSRAPVTEVATSSGAASASTGAVSDQAQRYAAREQQKPDVQNFQGGEGYVYIGGSVLTVALLIVLILILV